MKTLRFSYRGQSWVAYLAAEAEVGQLAEDENCPAFVETNTNEVYFSDNYELNLTNIMHELWHVAINGLFIETANLDQSQMEEVSAELFSHQGEELLALGKKITRALLKLKGMPDHAELDLEEKEEESQRKK